MGLIEFPHIPEIEFINLYKNNGENIKKLYDEIIETGRKTNGLIIVLTHPTPFKKWGNKIQEYFLTQDGFKIKTLNQVTKELRKKHKISYNPKKLKNKVINLKKSLFLIPLTLSTSSSRH